jgi:hypothetical protein
VRGRTGDLAGVLLARRQDGNPGGFCAFFSPRQPLRCAVELVSDRMIVNPNVPAESSFAESCGVTDPRTIDLCEGAGFRNLALDKLTWLALPPSR